MTESNNTSSGKHYADHLASYLAKHYDTKGLDIYREVSVGKSIIGKNRRVDILAVARDGSRAVAIECKFQDSQGTADEKIPYAIDDLRAMGMPAILTYAGGGFSEGVSHMLAACPIAAYCNPGPTLDRGRETRELDVQMAMIFGWWDALLTGKARVMPPPG